MSALSAIPGLNSEAIEFLEGAGILTAGALARLSAAEAHKRIEMSAWQKGKVQRAPGLATVQKWVRAATEIPGALEEIPAALPAPAWDQTDDMPEAIVLERATLPVKNVYVPPSQRARRAATGAPLPEAGPVPMANLPAAVPFRPASGEVAAGSGAGTATPDPSPLPVEEVLRAALPGFNTFDGYQAGQTRVAPLSRFSISAPVEPAEPVEARLMDRIEATASLSRWVQRGVQHPAPGLLLFGALISLLWRLAMLGGIVGLPWLILTSEKASDFRGIAWIAGAVLLVLGFAQLIVLGRARCRICSCHLFYSRDCVKNRKAHHIFGLGYTGSLALHLLIFQWFRCMYCGTAIRLWMSKRDR